MISTLFDLFCQGGWRVVIAALAVCVGLYFGAADFWVNRGGVDAGLMLLSGVAVAWTACKTSTFAELFAVDEPERLIPKLVWVATLLSILYNAPLADACLQDSYPTLQNSLETALACRASLQ